MPSLIASHPLIAGLALLLLDILAWRLLPASPRPWRVAARLGLFLLYSWVLISAGLSPLLPPPGADSAEGLAGTALEILWWLYGARTLTVVLGLVLIGRSGHTGRLLQDVLGALIFLLALVAAAAYVLQLPVKGLLATSGAMAIVVGLALQSTLADVFSGIILNTTRPYQLDDSIAIDGLEGKVIEIDWRATHLLTSQGSTAVIPNSLAAKAKIINNSRPREIHGVAITLEVPASIRPRRVLDALERTLRGCRDLLANPAPKVAMKSAGVEVNQYEISGFIGAGASKVDVRNLLFDLAHRNLEAAGLQRVGEAAEHPRSRERLLLDEVKVFRALGDEEKERLARLMTVSDHPAGQVLLERGDVAGQLLVIGSGVVSAALPDSDGWLEAGRMGPGEVMGEEGINGDAPSSARFTALTSCRLYRIDAAEIRDCLAQRSEVRTALDKLQAFRTQASQSLLTEKPTAIRKGGFLSWLHRR